MRFAPFRCIVTVNDQQTSFQAFDVLIASGGYQGGVLVAREANPYDGKIVVRILKGPSKWALAKKWARIALGVPFSPSDLEVIRSPGTDNRHRPAAIRCRRWRGHHADADPGLGGA